VTLATLGKSLNWIETPFEMRSGSETILLPGKGSGILLSLVRVKISAGLQPHVPPA